MSDDPIIKLNEFLAEGVQISTEAVEEQMAKIDAMGGDAARYVATEYLARLILTLQAILVERMNP